MKVRLRQVEALLDRFPWGKDGCPGRPAGTREAQLEAIERWVANGTSEHGHFALALIARLRPILDEVTDAIQAEEGDRFVYRFDSTNLVKSPSSILEKMAREPGAGDANFDFRTFSHEMDDIARFRIVVNFLSDIDCSRKAICAAFYRAEGAAPVSQAQQDLYREFQLMSGNFRDEINLIPAERKKGERCLKGSFRPVSPSPPFRIEVQIQRNCKKLGTRRTTISSMSHAVRVRRRIQKVNGRHLQ